jgi:hypothetical protein
VVSPTLRRLVANGRALALALALAAAPGCLVLSLNPAYDDDSIAWEPDLVGNWQNAEDNASITIERGEWRSYKVHYAHPIETGDLTAYLTAVGDERYLDLMPVRGEDRGSFLIPVHAVLHVRLQGDRLDLSPLSYDWFADRLREGRGIVGLPVSQDQKENALIVSPTAQLRTWLRGQDTAGPAFGAAATFTRVTKQKEG